MGLTYKAEDPNLRCPVALKLISPLLTGSRQARELFLAEARGAASLRHRNVAGRPQRITPEFSTGFPPRCPSPHR